MKKRYVILVFLSCILISTESFSQSSEKRYYCVYNEKIPLTEVEHKFIISFQKFNEGEIKVLINKENTEWANDSICIITTDHLRKEELKKILRQTRGVKSVQPMHATDHGSEMGITDEFAVKFKSDISQKQKDEWIKEHPAVVKKETELYLLMSVPVDQDALEIANLYQLSGLVV
jgi:hypothetical protein